MLFFQNTELLVKTKSKIRRFNKRCKAKERLHGLLATSLCAKVFKGEALKLERVEKDNNGNETNRLIYLVEYLKTVNLLKYHV